MFNNNNSSNFLENPNDNPCYYNNIVADFDENYCNNLHDFDDYVAALMADDDQHRLGEEDSTSSFNACLSQSHVTQEMNSTGSTSNNSFNGVMENYQDMQVESKRGMKRVEDNDDETQVVTFRCKTELEFMDDGYKWRKYGKKKVKSNTNPRNYYKCLSEGCNVKKKVERDGEDCSYVITSYEGVHNHESPSIVHYNYMPSPLPCQWSLQDSQYYG